MRKKMITCRYNGHFNNLQIKLVLYIQENMGWAYVF